MIWIEISSSIYGEAYSPGKAEALSGLTFCEKNEAGEIAGYGKYKGRPKPFGSSILLPPESLSSQDPDSAMEWLLRNLVEHRSHLQAAGADLIVVRMKVLHDGSCNFEFEARQLNELAAAGVALAVTCEHDPDYLRRKLDGRPER